MRPPNPNPSHNPNSNPNPSPSPNPNPNYNQAQAEPTAATSARQPEVDQRWSSPEAEAYASLHAKYALLLDEVQFHKHRAQSLAVENKRLLSFRFYGAASKRTIVEQLLAAQEALAREKRERAACEEGLSEAYNAHLKMLVASQGVGGASDADKSKSGRFIKKLQR